MAGVFLGVKCHGCGDVIIFGLQLYLDLAVYQNTLQEIQEFLLEDVRFIPHKMENLFLCEKTAKQVPVFLHIMLIILALFKGKIR